VQQREQLVDALWMEIKVRWGRFDLRRVKAGLDIWSFRKSASPRPRQAAKGFFLPDIIDGPWFDPQLFVYTPLLKESFSSIRDEAKQLLKGTISAPPYGLAEDASAQTPPSNDRPVGWREWRFVWRNRLVESRCAEFPKTAQVLKEVMTRSSFLMNAIFMIMQPGSELKRHCDASNVFANLWLGIFVPENCALEVVGQRRVPQPGQCLAFNHSYEHASWNFGATDRIVLSISTINPTLRTYEQEIVAWIIPRLEYYYLNQSASWRLSSETTTSELSPRAGSKRTP
jgi:aspartate beta-hydroxylase